MSKGDTVTILMDVGAGACREFTVTATKNGRTLSVDVKRGMVEVSEIAATLTRGSGDVVRTDRFMASRVVALIESKQEDETEPAATEPSLFDGEL